MQINPVFMGVIIVIILALFIVITSIINFQAMVLKYK